MMLFGRILFENPQFMLAAGLFGGLQVTNKMRGNWTIKARSGEKRYFHALTYELQQRGVPVAPGNKVFEQACAEFCHVMSPPGGLRWQVYLTTPPAEYAEELIATSGA